MKIITNCRSCGSDKLTEVLNLGEQYVSDFREDDSKTSKYPIEAVICDGCMLVQLRHTTPSGEMYHENYGFKSGVSDSIKNDLKDIVYHAQSYFDSPKSWLDIASNDGTLLSYVPSTCYKVGVDPVGFLCKEAEQHADLIVNDFFNGLDRQFDIITSISCFYDMDNPNQFVEDVKASMHDKSVWVIQQNYLLPTLQLNAIDNFCHEHLEYYTLLSLESLLERHGLEVMDLSTSMVNGGSIRTIVAHKGAYPVQDSVERQRTIESDAKLHTLEPYIEFGKKCLDNIELLKEAIKPYEKVFILAASTRGATIWQAAGFTPEQIPYAVERNPKKVGRYFSALGIPIISEEAARKLKPDAMIIGPWFFADEIVNREAKYLRSGGKLIIPLPSVKVI